MKIFYALCISFILSSCASYSVTEQEIQDYLDDRSGFERTVGVKGLAHANIKFENVKVGIGRVANDRVNLDADSKAQISIQGKSPQQLQIKVNFSAVPYYDKDEGAIFLNDLKVEDIDIQPNELNLPSKQLLSPIVEMVGQYLLTRPVYRLSDEDFKQSMLKTARPELLIKNHELVIQI
ncbi:DUF1439 domain-containing protein [Photobacterium sp. DNB23_23_1]|uniref:DUF1439 domain-containing protein n=1 Tax=Photobacterium pectinilyticum TaxID=2906793 RepID=A0ABT1MXA6_9GAMM|nr:DUF1439 domain-containing protein [Photobacterium sp. ZSDE20]MCQ1056912.1 DUF1439 domain-containing protein [Photobacterium sp. ZSDE20]MDD1821047.1 DUF1439 domain-containing protein [Photobacterium sp. ZSDE20]